MESKTHWKLIEILSAKNSSKQFKPKESDKLIPVLRLIHYSLRELIKILQIVLPILANLISNNHKYPSHRL